MLYSLLFKDFLFEITFQFYKRIRKHNNVRHQSKEQIKEELKTD